MRYSDGRVYSSSAYIQNPKNRDSGYSGVRTNKAGIYDYEKGRYVFSDKVLSKDLFERNENKEQKKAIERREKRAAERKRRKRKALIQRIAAGAAALGIGTGALIIKTADIKSPNEDIYITPFVTEAPQADMNEPEESIIIPDTAEIAQDIINSNPDVNENYNNITEALSRFSKQLGTDGLALIKNRVNDIGDGEIEVIDVLKILWIESRGRIYDDNGNYLVSYTGEAYGPFQLTPSTVDYINYYYGFTGTDKELDIMDPYDNLDACIYNLKFLKEKKENDLTENGSLPTGNNIMEAVFWGYHDGAWASDITQNGEYYIAQYRDLSIIDNYPEVVSYITDDLC